VDTEPPTPEEIARCLRAERADRRAPVFSADKAPRGKRRRAPRRKQHDLFDDFLPFVEKDA
jgi:hypothetical protein